MPQQSKTVEEYFDGGKKKEPPLRDPKRENAINEDQAEFEKLDEVVEEPPKPR